MNIREATDAAEQFFLDTLSVLPIEDHNSFLLETIDACNDYRWKTLGYLPTNFYHDEY